MKKRVRFLSGTVLLPLVMLALYGCWSVSPSGWSLETRIGLELLFKIRGLKPPPEKVVVIAVTKQGARHLMLPNKLYEWSRGIYGQLVNELTALNAQYIVFDVFFEKPRDSEGDQMFAKAMEASGRVLLFSRAEREKLNAGQQTHGDLQYLLQPMEMLRNHALGTAPLILPKIPARVNRFFVRHPATKTPTLHTNVWLRQQQDPQAARDLLEELPDALLYNFYGPPRTITTIDFADFLQNPSQYKALIENSVVFLGYSAGDQPDQKDGFYTAFTDKGGLDISGVELSATAYANLLQQNYLRDQPLWLWMLLVFSYGTGVYFAGRKLAPTKAALCIFGVAAITTGFVFWQFVVFYNWWPWFSSVIVLTPLCATVGMWGRSRELFKQKRQLQWAFGKYLPEDELQQLVDLQELPASRDFHHSVCMVTDAQGYSKLSESLSPVQLAELMQHYYQAIIPAIRDGGGVISDVAGDGVIALWPHLDAKNAWHRLTRVVESINKNVDDFNRLNCATPLPTRIGIHAGEIVMGHFGARDHHEFRAMGDIVNTTARIEGANKSLGTRVLVSEACVGDSPQGWRNLGRFQFVGKGNPLRLYSPIEKAGSDLLEQYENALAQFEQGQLDQARDLFSDLHKQFPQDMPSQYVARYLSDRRLLPHQKEQLHQGVVGLVQK